MRNAPNKWLAVLLSVVATPIGFLYVERAAWAAVYLLLAVMVAVYVTFFAPSDAVAGALNLVFLVVCAIHAYRLAKRFSSEGPRPWFSRWYGLLAVTVTLLVLGLAMRSFAYETFRQPSGSMLPTLRTGAPLLVQKWGYGNYGTFGRTLFRRPITAPLERGDIVVFEYPRDRSVEYLKRLVGLPGDKISYRGKTLFVNGAPAVQQNTGEHNDEQPTAAGSVMSESLLGRQYTILVDKTRPEPVHGTLDFPLHERCTEGEDGLSCQVPAGHYFMLGDNRDNSNDSRYWGFVPADHIVGKLVFIGK